MDRTSVRTQSGILLQTSPPIAGASGSQVTAMIRPENIQIVTENSGDCDNPLSGTIEEKTFLGQDLHLKLRINEAQTLTVVLGGRAARAYSVGDRLNVSVARSHVYLIRA